jgi:hypothetical protein
MILPTGEKVSGGMQAADFREVLDDAMAQAKPR